MNCTNLNSLKNMVQGPIVPSCHGLVNICLRSAVVGNLWPAACTELDAEITVGSELWIGRGDALVVWTKQAMVEPCHG